MAFCAGFPEVGVVLPVPVSLLELCGDSDLAAEVSLSFLGAGRMLLSQVPVLSDFLFSLSSPLTKAGC